jgi:hypothetical protein
MSTPPVDSTEIVFRQIGSGGNPVYYDPAQSPPIHQSVFLPAKLDSDGLSLLRARFRTQIWAAHRLENPTARYRLAQLRVLHLEQFAWEAQLQSLAFSSTPDALDEQHGEPWGHCVVATINRTDYEQNVAIKRCIKEWALRLANFLGRENVLGPFPTPTAADPIRP